MAPDVRTLAYDPRLGGYKAVPLDSMPAEVIRLVAQLQRATGLRGRVLIGVEMHEDGGNPWQADG